MRIVVRNVIMIIAILLAIALVTYAWLGTYSRMIADDYCTAAEADDFGAVGGVVHKYYTWSPGYSNFFVKYILAPLQPGIHRILPVLLLIGWLIAFFYLFTTLAQKFKVPNQNFVAALLSLIVTYVVINTIPSPQDIYWFAALIPYVIPVILTVGYSAWLIRYFSQVRTIQQDVMMAIIHVLMILIISGFTEIIGTYLVAAHGLALLLTPFVPKARRRTYLLIVIGGLVAGAANLIFTITAPGVAARQASVNDILEYERLSLPNVFLRAFSYTILFLFVDTFGLAHVLFLFSAIFIGLVAHYQQHESSTPAALPNIRNVAIITFIVSFLLIMSVAVPSVYAAGVIAPRTFVIGRVTQMLMVVVLAYLAATVFIRRHWFNLIRRSSLFKPVLGAIILMLGFLPILTIMTNLRQIPEFSSYATGWDARHDVLRMANSGDDVLVPALEYDIEDFLNLEKIEAEPIWVNNCAANYYDLGSITVDATTIPDESE